MKGNYGPIVHEGQGTTGGLYKCIISQRNEECGQRGAVGGCRLKNTAQKNDLNNIKKSTQVSIYIGSKQLGRF